MPAAQHRHLQEVSAQIYRWAFRLLQNHHEALDATQSVLLRILQAADKTQPPKSAWIRKVTTNYCIDQIRKKRPRSLQAEPADHRPAEIDRIGDSDQHEKVIDALQALTETQRLVLLAKTYDGETFARIAESMNLSVSSVKTHYLRALRHMRDRLRKYQEGHDGPA